MDRINNNIKFYTFIDILETYSDKNVSLSVKEINHHIKKRLGIELDRRTIYNYMRDMKALGFDVSDYDKDKEGYYLNSHRLEPHEIKILSDAVLTSNFITHGKSLALLEKLKTFNSIYQNSNFIQNIFIEDVPKSTNEEIFGSMIFLDRAIRDCKKVMFNYCNYDCFKNLVCRVDEDGEKKVYVKSPVYLVLRNKNYYLVCADEECEVLQNYRVDRMLNVTVMDEDIMDLSKFVDCRNGFNPMEYLRKSFKMFSGENAIVVVAFGDNLLNYFLDEFGEYIYIMKKDDFRKNNLEEEVRLECFGYQILEKILGKRDYNERILTGRYMEEASTRGKLEDFSRELKRIVGICEDECDEEKEARDQEESGSASGGGKKYIGIFVAKSGVGLAKWILQFGTDVEVVFPKSLRALVKSEIDGMNEYYSE